MLLIDAHLDLAMNALEWNRDLNLSVEQVRQAEAGMKQKGRGCGTTTLPELRRAEVPLTVATVISRTGRPGSPASGTAHQEISYAKAQGQLAYYRVLESQNKVRIIANRQSLEQHIDACQQEGAKEPLGIILSMEGADPIVWPEQIHNWKEDGLRAVGLSHYGISAYAYGTGTEGGLLPQGKTLLREMERAGTILDVTHLADQAFLEATDAFDGPVLASHSNCRSLVPGQRQFDDGHLRAIINRDGVIGTALDAWMLQSDWIRGETTNENLTLGAVADHIDHVCQLAGNALHAAIGSDLDGGYGTEQTPRDLDTIADLQKIPNLLKKKGYGQKDIANIMHGNWVRFFREAWS